MSAMQIDTVISHHDRSVGDARFLTGTDEPRVVEFYRSIGSPFFGAVVSSCGIHARMPDSFSAAEAEPRPTLVTLLGELDLSTGAATARVFRSHRREHRGRLFGARLCRCTGFGNLRDRAGAVSADTCRVRARRADQVAVEVAPDHGP